MNKRFFRWVALVVIVLVIFFTLVGCSANEVAKVTSLRNGEYVYDKANVIKNDEQRSINNMLKELDVEAKARFIVVTTKYCDDIDEYATKMFSDLGLNSYLDERNSNILLVFSKRDNKLVVKTTSELMEVLDESLIKRVLSKYFTPYTENKDYTTAIKCTVKSLVCVIASEYGADVTNLEFSSPYGNHQFSEFWVIVFSLIFVAITLAIIYHKYASRS